MDIDNSTDFDTDDGVVSDNTDTADTIDTSDYIDSMLDGKSLDELYALRDELTSGGSPDNIGLVDIKPIDDELHPDLEEITEPTKFEAVKPIDDPPDYTFHWDGSPTHIIELDDETEPTSYTKKLTR